MLYPVRSLKPLLALLLLFAVVCVPSVVFAINLNGSWTYRETGGDSVDTFREFRQNYSFGVGPALNYQPSHALTVNASVGYTQTDRVDDDGSRTDRTVTPTAGLSLLNDIFSARVSGNVASTKSDGRDWHSSTTWNANLDSAWDELYVPKLYFTYGEFGEESQSSAVATPKTQNKVFGAGVDWDLLLAEISYRYRQTRSEDRPDNQSHYVKLETAGRFWDDRAILTLSQQAQYDTLKLGGGAQGGTTDVPVGKIVRYAISPGAAPVNYSCNVTSTPGVDCLTAAAFPIAYPASRYVQVAISPLESRQIGAVEISFNADYDRGSDSLWDFYEYRTSSDSWQLIAQALPVVETTEEDVGGITNIRQRIEIPETDQEFILVSDLRPVEGRISSVDIFELFSLQPGGSERTNRRYLTNAGIQMRLTETVSSSLGLTYDRFESETDGSDTADLDTDKLTTNGSISWAPFSFLTVSGGASEYREWTLGEEQQRNRSYSLVFGTDPLPTVNVSFGILVNERYGVTLESGAADIDRKTLETTRYSVSGKAQLYPDLTASFNLSHGEGKRWLKDEDADTGRYVDNTAQSGRLDLNAKLYKNLTADLITRYTQSKNDGFFGDTGSAELGLRFRLSELLLLRGTYKTYFIGKDDPDLINLRAQLRLLDTDKTRLETAVSHTQADETVEVVSFHGSWLVSKNVSMLGRGAYVFGESNSYNIRLDLRIGI